MLGKLLKYDFKSLSKILLPVYLICFLVALLTRGSNLLAQKFSIFSVPNGFISAVFIIALITIPIATFIFTIIKFYQGLVKDEGYLMHTIPVSKASLVLSKTISSMIFLIFSAIVSFGLLFLGVYGIWFDAKLMNFILDLFKYVDIMFIVLTIIAVFISVIFQQLMFYSAIALGQKHNSKGVFAVIYGVVLYNVTQFISVIILLPIMFLDPSYQKMMNSNSLDFSLMNPYMAASLIVSVLFTAFYYWLTVRTLDKNLNLQ